MSTPGSTSSGEYASRVGSGTPVGGPYAASRTRWSACSLGEADLPPDFPECPECPECPEQPGMPPCPPCRRPPKCIATMATTNRMPTPFCCRNSTIISPSGAEADRVLTGRTRINLGTFTMVAVCEDLTARMLKER